MAKRRPKPKKPAALTRSEELKALEKQSIRDAESSLYIPLDGGYQKAIIRYDD